MKKRYTGVLMISALVLAWCWPTSTAPVGFDGLQINVPTDFSTVSSSSLDSYQIINKILKVYKNGTKTLIIARSTLNASLTSEEYANTSREKLAASMPGYSHSDDGTLSFTCWKEKIKGYTHSFSVATTKSDDLAKTYIIQYYFIAQGTPYIISEADVSSSHYSDFTSMLSSLHCN